MPTRTVLVELRTETGYFNVTQLSFRQIFSGRRIPCRINILPFTGKVYNKWRVRLARHVLRPTIRTMEKAETFAAATTRNLTKLIRRVVSQSGV